MCALYAGCGTEETPEPQAAQQGDPWHVVLTLEPDLAEARARGRARDREALVQLLGQTGRTLESRLRTAGFEEFNVRLTGEARFHVGFRELALHRRPDVVALLTRPGTLEFMIEVLPDARYRQRLDFGDEAPPRRGLWPSSAADFDAYLRAEGERWRAARAEDAPYVPSRPGYRLVCESGKDGSSTGHFHLLEVPPADKRFDGRMVKDPVVSLDQMNQPVVVFDVRKTWQQRFGDWTEANLFLPVAIVLDGEFHSAPTIRARLTTNVQISLGRGPRSEIEREAESLANVLQTGALDVPLRLLSIDTN